MGLLETQQILAQLYTNSDLRERFFTNPNIVGLELGLSVDETQQLAQLFVKDVNNFANSLKWKRLGEVRELLPRTVKVLGKNFNSLFWRYAETYLPQGIKKHRDDAIAFADFILKVAEEESIEPVWISDLLRYEKTWLLASESHSYLQICWFRYAIHLDCTAKPMIAIWWRLSARCQGRAKRSHLQHFMIGLPPLISKLNQ
ncbi:hypothetical protein H6G54_14005 [Anabaena cylindrica FACHB-243]|uniref:Uncharacterized protein n=1 Tax=Anabaena cylindrica (strain ATCC 27899 / PCC 7122) TaxID=272123 RepID=K9ZL86_ANACC|nr:MULTISPECIES: hypothetical protein [Anabaena]AFZ59544.1 hypothetical protein Anacy_4178 [Anabaena cylindrica PCC 7122]MBD2418790.1 hypothetical protein [Anabaena cylindrica FACHB-243]MCM2406355.1 hypothetical protein [Anabaena sp. CCAP 1446/1C]BAY03413.1 hypothetical protein NIES19_26660 [Anabaena cylindrica PCC 7122]